MRSFQQVRVQIAATGCWDHSAPGAALCEGIRRTTQPRRFVGLVPSRAISLSNRDGPDGVFSGVAGRGVCWVFCGNSWTLCRTARPWPSCGKGVEDNDADVFGERVHQHAEKNPQSTTARIQRLPLRAHHGKLFRFRRPCLLCYTS